MKIRTRLNYSLDIHIYIYVGEASLGERVTFYRLLQKENYIGDINNKANTCVYIKKKTR